MDEMERYRAKIERRYRRRRTPNRYAEGGRRIEDYKPPKFWTLDFIVQIVVLAVGGLCLLILGGCAAIKKSILGG